MHGEEHLTGSEQYAFVFKKGRSWADDLIIVKAAPNSLELSRWGISVSRHVGGAVVRNRVKRLFREILRQTELEPGWDIVFIGRPAVATTSYQLLENSVKKLTGQSWIIEVIRKRLKL